MSEFVWSNLFASVTLISVSDKNAISPYFTRYIIYNNFLYRGLTILVGLKVCRTFLRYSSVIISFCVD